jgi:ferric-chelate reductase
MDGGMGMGGGDSSTGPLSPAGVDFNNETQALDFLSAILDDTYLQLDGNNAARNFWYGIVVVMVIAGICNAIWQLTLHSR